VKRTLLFLWCAAADLALDGLLGILWFTVLIAMVSTGISLLPAFGIGIALLWLTAYAARGIFFVERQRAQALYDIRITPPTRKRTTAQGFGGWIAQVFLDVFSGAFWKGFLHTLLSLVLGTVFWVLLQSSFSVVAGLQRGALDGLSLPFSGPLVAVVGGVLALAVVLLFIYGAGSLDRLLAPALLGTSRTAALEQRVDVLQDARQGAVDAASIERQRIERDLHDGVQPRLVAIAMTLGMAQGKLDSDPAGARALIDEAHRETKESITELRHLARGIHPAVLTDRGLDAALSAVASYCTVPTTVRVDLPTRPSTETEAVIYFAVSEALTNVSKHSRAATCSVGVTQTPNGVLAVVFDDGVGGAELGRGGGVGLAGLADRVRSAGGSVAVHSPAGGPTVLTVEVPCAF
jgi:signal transduction histidine kinase